MATEAIAAVMNAPNGALELITYPLPKVQRDTILVKTTCCTVCGSDLHTWKGRRKSPLPIVLGHEVVGRVVALGQNRTHDLQNRPLRVGDRITWTIMSSCGRCFYCRQAGLPMKCRQLRKYGHDRCDRPPHFTGGFAEFVYILPGTDVLKVPESLADEEVAPANCTLATAIAGWEAVGLKPFETVVIQGAGALGVYASALADHYGCKQIIVMDKDPARLAFIKQFGATHTFKSDTMDSNELSAAVRGLTGGFGADCVVGAAGTPALVPLALNCLRIGGRYLELGTVYPGASATVDMGDLVFKMLTIQGIHNYDARHLQLGLDFLEMTRKRYPFKEIVGQRFALADINAALAAAEQGQSIRVAVVP